jgi:transcriptional regulator with XRE-family HTH domain
MTKIQIKERAIHLRQKGTSIAEIAQLLEVSKSTVSGWCRNISLSESSINRIAKRGNENATRALMQYSEIKRMRRKHEEAISHARGAKTVQTLSQRDIYCIGLGLYWGEGYKKGSQEFGFTNSDPSMILFYIKWLGDVFSINKKDLIVRVSINELHTSRISKVESYWSKLLFIPISQFTKPSLIKTNSKKRYDNHSTHMGTLRIKVRRGTTLRREVLGAINNIYTIPNSPKTRR